MATILSIITAISSIVIIVTVAITESENQGLGTIDGSSPSEALWGANRGTSKKEVLKRTTIIASVIFFISLLLIAKF